MFLFLLFVANSFLLFSDNLLFIHEFLAGFLFCIMHNILILLGFFNHCNFALLLSSNKCVHHSSILAYASSIHNCLYHFWPNFFLTSFQPQSVFSSSSQVFQNCEHTEMSAGYCSLPPTSFIS
jgi:hypothetical protein